MSQDVGFRDGYETIVEHIVGLVTLGYNYIRFPLYERIRIPGLLDDASFDLAWSPFLARKWRPSY